MLSVFFFLVGITPLHGAIEWIKNNYQNTTTTIPTYIFPTRYEATTYGWVSDGFVNHEKAYVIGYMYTDYTQQIQRIDEIWNITSIINTTLYNTHGIIADSHLFKQNYGYYWFINTNTLENQCWISASGMLDQYTFANASNYQGDATYNGIECYKFVSQSSFDNLHYLSVGINYNNNGVSKSMKTEGVGMDGNINDRWSGKHVQVENATVQVTLYVAKQTQVPVAMVVPSIGNYFDGSVVTFATFNDRNDELFPDYLFQIPSYCSL